MQKRNLLNHPENTKFGAFFAKLWREKRANLAMFENSFADKGMRGNQCHRKTKSVTIYSLCLQIQKNFCSIYTI